jgi:predicted dehydrogenase
MATHSLGIIMHGITGRMGKNQHLFRSIRAIMDEGGLTLENGDVVQLKPLLVGRNLQRVQAVGAEVGIDNCSDELDAALADPSYSIFFDAASTQLRPTLLRKAIAAGKHIYCEKPTADSLDEALALAAEANKAGVKHGVVQDKLYLPGLLKLKKLVDADFFGRILSLRIEFGYWVFTGDGGDPQRPSWNYRQEDGGGIVIDMMCHWQYVLAGIFGKPTDISCTTVTHVHERINEIGEPYRCTADDAAYATVKLDNGIIAQINSDWCTRVNRDDLVTFQVDGMKGSAVATLTSCKVQSLSDTPRPVWNPDEKQTHRFQDDWQEVDADMQATNGFRIQWEKFINHVVADGPWTHGLEKGAESVQLAEIALASATSRSWQPVPALDFTPAPALV